MVVAVELALAIGDRFIRLPSPLNHPAHDAFALALQVGGGAAWSLVGLLLDTTIIALALETADGASIAKAFMASVRSLPALLPFQILSMLPWLADIILRQPSPPGLDTPMEQAVFLFALLGQGAFGVALTAAWGLIAPVAVAERCGARAALSRSWRRLSGNRWVLAWLDIAIIATVTIATIAASEVTMSAIKALGQPSARIAFQIQRWVMIVLPLMTTAFWLVITAASYRQLNPRTVAATDDRSSPDASEPTLAETLPLGA
jgi:hypothetical protein